MVVMDEVKRLWESDKKVVITLTDNNVLETDWFEDNYLEKHENQVNTTKNIEEKIEELLEKDGKSKEDIETWYVQCYKENDTIYLTEHALQRLKERNGWNKKTALRMLKKVYEEGLKQHALKGFLRHWVEHLKANHPECTYIVYGEKVYIFRTKTLITVINIPKNMFAK